MKHIIKIILSVLIFSTVVYGQIKVSYVGGEAYFERNSVSQRITFGMEIKPGDVITTGKSSFVALLFEDGSIHKVTANTVYEIKRYESDEKSRFQLFNIVKGKIFSFVSKTFKKSDIKFLTPTAVVGVRGTTFVTEVDEVGTTVYMMQGKVDLFDVNQRVSVPLEKGQKGNVQGGLINKEPMKEKDYKDAAKDVPVSLGEVNIGVDGVSQEEANNNEEKEDKNFVRGFIDNANEKIDQQREAINENRVWDYRSEKAIGDFRVTQVVKRTGPNEISLITHTYDTKAKQENSLDLGIIFNEAIPTIGDVFNDVKRDINEINWRIAVADSKGKDELRYEERIDTTGKSDTSKSVSFNGKIGGNLNVEQISIQESNIDLPGKIAFKIEDKKYVFDLDYSYINSAGKEMNSVTLDKVKDKGTYNRILNGDLDTQISIKASIPNDVKVNSKFFESVQRDGTGSFKIIVINNFLFPLFNNISS